MDELEKLKCTVAGCNNRWSVNMGMPKCSFHQWNEKKPATARDIATLLSSEPVKHWQDDDTF